MSKTGLVALIFLSIPFQNLLSNPDPLKTIDEIFTILGSGAQLDYIGEKISQLDHVLQCAQLAALANSDEETIIAALLHDIGHMCARTDAPQMNGLGVAHHEDIGADFLKERGFSQKVQDLVRSHVNAKRYLTYKYPEYYNKLSEASKETLNHQGGPMTATEALAFEQAPYFKEKLFIRSLDEKAKIVNAKVIQLASYKDMLIRHLTEKNHA